MFASRIARANHVHTPMIRFLGSRKNVVYEPHAPAPHPAAPKEVVEHFQSFLAKLQSSSKGPSWPSSTPKGQSTEQSAKGLTPGQTAGGAQGQPQALGFGKASKPADYDNYWEAPSYYWATREVSEREMEAIESGGATDIRSGP